MTKIMNAGYRLYHPQVGPFHLFDRDTGERVRLEAADEGETRASAPGQQSGAAATVEQPADYPRLPRFRRPTIPDP